MVKITEIFASQQMEGRECGKTTIFVRFEVCNMIPRCVWCDSMYIGEEMSIEEILEKIKSYDNIYHITFTGGEPALYLKEIYKIMQHLPNYTFSVETNGLKFISPKDFTTVAVSPKKQNLNRDLLKIYSHFDNVIFKPVIEDEESYEIWKELFDCLEIERSKVYMMPLGTDSETIKKSSKVLAQWCIRDGINMSTRVQILLYEKRKGV